MSEEKQTKKVVGRIHFDFDEHGNVNIAIDGQLPFDKAIAAMRCTSLRIELLMNAQIDAQSSQGKIQIANGPIPPFRRN